MIDATRISKFLRRALPDADISTTRINKTLWRMFRNANIRTPITNRIEDMAYYAAMDELYASF